MGHFEKKGSCGKNLLSNASVKTFFPAFVF